MPMQVVRSKHKVRSFVFSPAPRKGSLAQLTLALANNSVEVRGPGPGACFIEHATDRCVTELVIAEGWAMY